jgi:hypothetical protein
MPVFSNSTTIAYDELALAAYVRSVTPTLGFQQYDSTTLADSSQKFTAGLRENNLTIEGLFDSTTGAGTLFTELTGNAGSDTAVPTTIAPAGFSAGASAYLLPAKTVNLALSSTVSDLVPFTLTLGAGGNGGFGTCLTGLAALTASGNSTSQDDTASSSNGLLAHLHITAVSGTTPSMTVTIEHSTNNSTWATLGSFSAATAIGSQILNVSGTVNRYVRAAYTISGTTPSFTTLIAYERF